DQNVFSHPVQCSATAPNGGLRHWLEAVPGRKLDDGGRLLWRAKGHFGPNCFDVGQIRPAFQIAGQLAHGKAELPRKRARPLQIGSLFWKLWDLLIPNVEDGNPATLGKASPVQEPNVSVQVSDMHPE